MDRQEATSNIEGSDRGQNWKQAAAAGMQVAFHARRDPERRAIVSDAGDRSFAGLNARANQLVRALRARGLRRGERALSLGLQEVTLSGAALVSQPTG